MRFLIVAILLAFPFAEIFLLVDLAHKYGWSLLVYLVVVAFLGLQLIRGEKLLLSAKVVQSLAGGNPVQMLLGSARNMVAGVLLIIPGVISDVIAVILLLIPIQNSKPNTSSATNHTANHQQTEQTTFNQPGFNNSSFKQSGFKNKPNAKAANDDVIEGEYTEIKEDK